MGADRFTTGLHKALHVFFSTRVSYGIGLEVKGYKGFKIAGIKGLSKTAQQYHMLLGMFHCQKKNRKSICCSCHLTFFFFSFFSYPFFFLCVCVCVCGLGVLLISIITLRELPTANVADVLSVAETSMCHNCRLQTVLWFKQLSTCRWGGEAVYLGSL